MAESKGKKLLEYTDVLDKDTSSKIQALKEIRKNTDFKYKGLEKAIRDEIVNSIPESSITSKDFSKINKSIKEIPEEEIWDIYNKFTQMLPEERAKYGLGSGAYKDVYQLPNTDLVIKTTPAQKDLNVLEKDYLSHKITNKLGKRNDIETPMLVKSPDKEAILMQRRLVTPDDILKFKNAAGDSGVTKINPEFFNKAYFGEGLKDEIDNLIKGYTPTSMPEDVHAGNVGIDPITNKMKIFDTLGSVDAMDVVEKQTPRFSNILNNLKKPTIYRSIPLIGPAIGAGVAAMSGEANAASAMPILGEADSLGPEKGSEDYAIENPQASPELRRKALESLLKK
jgi:uncharacterized FlaG/YvyC family protein